MQAYGMKVRYVVERSGRPRPEQPRQFEIAAGIEPDDGRR